MENIIIIGILFIIIGSAIIYILKEKKKGTGCIGCPAAGCCSAKGCRKIAKDGNSHHNLL